MFDWVSDFFSESMWVFDRTLLYFIYWIEQVFNILAGLRQIPSSSTNTKDLLYNFLKDDSLTKVFSVMLLIGLGMFVICLMWGTIKATFFNKNSKDSFKKVLLSSFKALIYMVFIPVFVFCGIWIFSQLLTIISNAFQIQLTGSATSQITSGMSDAEITDIYQKSSIAQSLFLRCFRTESLSTEALEDLIFTMDYDKIQSVGINMNMTSGDFQYFVCFFVTGGMLFSLALAAIALCERIINIALLYLVSPLVVGASPLDEGKRMETWRDLMLSKIMGILGNIMSMNIFLLLLGYVSKSLSANAASDWQNQMIINVLYFVISIAGSFMAFKGSQLISSLISQASGTQEGFSQMTSASLARGSMHAIGAGLGKAKSLFGGSGNKVSTKNASAGGLNSSGGGSSGGGSTVGAAGVGGLGQAAKNHGKVAANSFGKVAGLVGGGLTAAGLAGTGGIALGMMGMMAPVALLGAGIAAATVAPRHIKNAIGRGKANNKANKETAKNQLKTEGALTGNKKADKQAIKQRVAENKELNKLNQKAQSGDQNARIQSQMTMDSRMQKEQKALDDALVNNGIAKKGEVTDEQRKQYGSDEMRNWLANKPAQSSTTSVPTPQKENKEIPMDKSTQENSTSTNAPTANEKKEGNN